MITLPIRLYRVVPDTILCVHVSLTLRKHTAQSPELTELARVDLTATNGRPFNMFIQFSRLKWKFGNYPCFGTTGLKKP